MYHGSVVRASLATSARVPGSSPGGDSQFFLQTFPVCVFASNQHMICISMFLSDLDKKNSGLRQTNLFRRPLKFVITRFDCTASDEKQASI